MRQILLLFCKDTQVFLKDRTAVALTFLLPLVMIYIFGQVFGVARGSSGPVRVPLAIVDNVDSAATRQLIGALERDEAFRVIRVRKDGDQERPLTEADVRAGIGQNHYRFALLMPARGPDAPPDAPRLLLLYNPRNDIETQTVLGLLQKALFSGGPSFLTDGMLGQVRANLGDAQADAFLTRMSQTIADGFGLDAEEVRNGMLGVSTPDPLAEPGAAGAEAPAAEFDFLREVVGLEKEQVGGLPESGHIANATRQIGGFAVMFLLFSVSGSASSLLDERRAGIFVRLLSLPLTRSHILASKCLFNITLGLVQLVVCFTTGGLLFGVSILPHLPLLLLVSLSAAAACVGFGMLVASFAKTSASAAGLSTFLILTQSALGGAWFPVSMMPEAVQTFSRLTLVYWAQDAFLQVLWDRHGLVEILPVLAVLIGSATVLLGAALWRFRRGDLFA